MFSSDSDVHLLLGYFTILPFQVEVKFFPRQMQYLLDKYQVEVALCYQ